MSSNDGSDGTTSQNGGRYSSTIPVHEKLHYVNLPMQYTEIVSAVKIEKIYIFFYFLMYLLKTLWVHVRTNLMLYYHITGLPY